jgi:hypothetical protein
MNKIQRASDFKPQDPIDLVENILVQDVVILAGRKGTGKSQMIAHWSACITQGKEFVQGIKPRLKGEVAIFHAERSIKQTLIPRLIAAGDADRRNVHLCFADDLTDAALQLATLVETSRNLRLVIIDPLNAYLDGKSPTNAKARKLLKPFIDLCTSHGICVVLVHHFTKSGNKELLSMIGGSAGWAEAAGSVWAVAKLKDGFMLQHVVCNVLDVKGQCWEYIVEPATITGRTRATQRVIMLEPSAVEIEMALALGKDMAISSIENAILQITKILQDGPKPAAHVTKKLADLGISRATWKRAQAAMREAGKLEYIVKGRRTDWKLVESESQSAGADDWDSDS